jgi:hypothetical protein
MAFMSWTDLLRTVATLGFGAVVAGAFSLLAARFAYKRDARARYSTRRSDHLEKLLESVVEIEHTYIKQKSAFEKYIALKTSNPAEAAKAKISFEALDSELYAGLENGVRISSFLLLLGETKANLLFWEYHDALFVWFQQSAPDLEGLSESALDDIRKTLRSAREKLLGALATAYKEN